MAIPAGATYADGAIPWDSQTATIGGTTFILEDFSPEESSTFQRSNDQYGIARGGRYTKDPITATCTALYSVGGTQTLPSLFAVVSLQYRGVAKDFILMKIGTPEKAGMEQKVSMSFQEKLAT